ncbi:DUF924 domain-containing protein [Primorskyibacter aestuariivivens]|uniref:DUF924 family protein n=1 Tax=Primorskyibacter aestuariivivens TaxID=1888912 RepID=UPI002300FFCC|nr:DUF924 family protein [Primorskyibacter aestuariivivens]MDA7428881.1 DUF924 domain-containing protein [Primorskyibacter aestuariivivens]
MSAPEEILAFWLDEVGPAGWYDSSDALDAEITSRFEPVWQGAMEGRHALWLTYPTGALAYIILMDQFPRNMFRGTARAFASDKAGLAAAKSAIAKGWDMKIDPPARQFFYMPLMHSENLCDQERCVRLMHERMPTGNTNLLHARVHREIIRKFGRFPYRNEALDRRETGPEAEFIANGGYRETLQELQAAS